MIRVARAPNEAAERALSRAGKDALTEAERAIWFYTGERPVRAGGQPTPRDAAQPRKPPKFEAYRSEAVKEALHAMFKGRCAYCETYYAAAGPMDVEHYRPKSAYRGEDGKLVRPGYYWLAAAWENLLPSCPDCNRERNQLRSQRTGKPIKAKSGKANRFPLAAGSPRAQKPGDHEQENPLLLNPCEDDPERHLHFACDGFVLPANTPEERALPKGRTTIEVCGLDRELLRAKRRAVSLRVQDAIERICACEINLREDPLQSRFRTQLASAEEALARLLSDVGDNLPEYLALTKSLVATFQQTRVAAAEYHAAVKLTRSGRSAAGKKRVEEAIAKIFQLLAEDQANASMTTAVLAYLEVPEPKLA